jgi:hypothetical protein
MLHTARQKGEEEPQHFLNHYRRSQSPFYYLSFSARMPPSLKHRWASPFSPFSPFNPFTNIFLTMYFGLPRYIPPRLLGETEVRKQWSTKYYYWFTLIFYIKLQYYRYYMNITSIQPLCMSRNSICFLIGTQFRQIVYRLSEIQYIRNNICLFY